jgi:hypothetical protein
MIAQSVAEVLNDHDEQRPYCGGFGGAPRLPAW